MKNPDYSYKDKKVVVVGLARSGLSACKLLKNLGAAVFATDNSDSGLLRENAAPLINSGVEIELGAHSIDFMRGKDLVVVSPGAGDKSLPLIWAAELKIPVISEIELAWSVSCASVIAITGTNGKTTVTTLLAELLNACGKKAIAAGNIGRPFSEAALSLSKDDFVSLEVSSFQLERISRFKPKIAVILNLSRDHLDRYKNMDEYLNAKKRIFRNQDKDDYLVLNYDQPVLRGLRREARGRVRFFGNKFLPEKAGRNLNHNHLAVMAVGGILGIRDDECRRVFNNFKGVNHRLEKVRVINDIEFINDSKATNVDSAGWALKNISRPVILIAGGRDKKSDYSQITDLIRQKVRLLVLFGEAREKIRGAFSAMLDIEEASCLEEAVDLGFSRARPGDCVLLSPMCSSFDMFRDYEHRGEAFKEAVGRLK